MLYLWHRWLRMPKQDEAWHRQDLADELAEFRAARTPIEKWSEVSDVVYTCTRGRWSGHAIAFPLSKAAFIGGIVYMYPKYTLRVLFFRRAGKRAGATHTVHEVRNPRKAHKLHHIAEKHGLNPATFQQICERQLKHWPLLP